MEKSGEIYRIAEKNASPELIKKRIAKLEKDIQKHGWEINRPKDSIVPFQVINLPGVEGNMGVIDNLGEIRSYSYNLNKFLSEYSF